MAAALLVGALAHENETVGADTRTDAAVTHVFTDCTAERHQKGVAGVPAEGVVIHLEIVDIRADDVILPVGKFIKQLFGFRAEKLQIVKPREPVEFKLIGKRGIFAQVDKTGNPMQNDLRIVGLGDKVGRAVVKRGYLVGVGVALRGDDHGGKREISVGADRIEEGIAVHDRHHDIKEYEGDVVCVLPEHVQCRETVFRLKHTVLFGQNPA